MFDVHVPTHVSAIANFVDGGVAQSVFSFDSPLTRMGYVEVTGTEGTMIIPDPDMFTGDVKITRARVRRNHGGSVMGRRADHRRVRRTGPRRPRPGEGVPDRQETLASGELGFHVLDTLVAIDQAITQDQVVTVESRVDRVPLVADDFDPFAATL